MSDAVPGRQDVSRPTDLPIRLIDEKGAAVRGKRAAGFEAPDPETLLSLYRRMVVARRFEAQGPKQAFRGAAGLISELVIVDHEVRPDRALLFGEALDLSLIHI